MSSNRRNIDILQKIIQYCDEIGEANEKLGNSLEALKSSSIYKNATAMCILQIGELTKHLSDDFRSTYNEMPWRDIRNMRNIAAHQYGSFSLEYLWDTITGDIPALRQYCAGIVKQYQVLEQEIQEEPEQEMQIT